jgi:hypothetical protein
MEEQGLAAQGAQPQGQVTVEMVIEALMKGATPEQLLQAGVPREMIEQAIMIIQQQMQQQQPQAPADAGLAAMA